MLEAALVTVGVVGLIVYGLAQTIKHDVTTFRCDVCGITWEGRDQQLIMRIATVHDCVKQRDHNTL